MSTVTNKDAADVLFNVATILELAEDNPYRIRAYRRAARLLLARPTAAKVALVEGKAGKELDVPGLGQRLRRKLGELLATGRMRFYVELCAELPTEVASLMRVPGVGPKTARRLHEELGVSSAAELYAAAQAGRVRTLYGFGRTRERQLLEGASAVLAGHVRSFAPVPVDLDEVEGGTVAVLPEPRALPLPLALPMPRPEAA